MNTTTNNDKWIFGKIAACDACAARNSLFKAAFDFLRRPDLPTIPPGTYPLVQDASGAPTVKAIVSNCALKPAGAVQHPEVHRAWIDIQAPITGEETIGVVAFPDDRAACGFDDARDAGFLDCATELHTLKPGDFAVFFPPCGGHAPGLTLSGATSVKKVVIKVKA